jgi:hypothetical protein
MSVATEPDFVDVPCSAGTSRPQLEIPSELVPDTLAERSGKLVPRGLLEVLRGNCSMHWKDDPDRPCREAGNHHSVTHRQFKHASKPGLVTVAGKPGDDLAPGTRNSVFKQAGLKP